MRLNQSNIVYNRILNSDIEATDYEVATYGGVAKKTLFYLLMVFLGAFGGILLAGINANAYAAILGIACMTTFIFSLISFFSPRACKVTGSIYCLLEGVIVGFVSLVYGAVANGAVMAALVSTLMVFTVVATLFVTNIVKVNSRFYKFLIIFAVGFILSQLALWLILTVTGQQYGFGLTLGVSAITVFLATLYLFFDLEHIRQIVEGGYPKSYEWYTSFGLVFTLVWLYVEILRIVAIVFNNRN